MITKILSFDTGILENDETSLCLKADEVHQLRKLIEGAIPEDNVLRFKNGAEVIRGQVAISITIGAVKQ